MQLADALVETLMAFEVRHVFGVSGANIEHLHDAIHRLGGGRLSSVLAKSEDGAAFMADGYARAHRRIGVCCATSGGGMMNLIAGVAEANQSSVPLLAIVGQPPLTVEGRGAFQDSSGVGRSVDAVKMFEAVSKYTRKIDRAEIFWDSLRDALIAALGGRRGASVLLIPRSLYTMEVGSLPNGFVERVRAVTEPLPVDRMQVLSILDELRMARRPVLVIGQGAMRTADSRPLYEFADALDIPVATTMTARGEFPNDHRNFLGVLGVAGHPSAHAFIRDQCDLLLLAGTGLNTMTRAPFARDRVDLPNKRIVAVNLDMGELLRVIESKPIASSRSTSSDEAPSSRSWWPQAVEGLALAVQRDVSVVFAELSKELALQPFRVRPRGAYEMLGFEPAAAPSQPRHLLANAPTSSKPLLQSAALEALANHLPENGRLIFDAGNCAAAALHTLPIPRGTRSLIALGMGGMGYAIAAAIGAQLDAPAGERTMVFTGDGSFLMVGMEIHTAVELELPILYVVFNNNMHGMCATRQQVFFESRFESVSYGPVDVAATCRGLGPPERLWIRSAETVEQLEASLRDFDTQPVRTGVLELRLAVEELPPFTPLLRADSRLRVSLPPPPPRS